MEDIEVIAHATVRNSAQVIQILSKADFVVDSVRNTVRSMRPAVKGQLKCASDQNSPAKLTSLVEARKPHAKKSSWMFSGCAK